MLALGSPARQVTAALPNDAKLALSRAPHPDVAALMDDITAAAVDALMAEHGGPAWDEAGFAALAAAVGAGLEAVVTEIVTVVARVLGVAQAVEVRVRGTSSLTLLPALTDIRGQLDGLVYRGFVAATGRRRLPDLVRYLRGVERRLEKLPENPGRDRALMSRVEQVQEWYDDALARLAPGEAPSADLAAVRWMIEELRVSLFAQGLRTAYPVSEQRIRTALDRATRS